MNFKLIFDYDGVLFNNKEAMNMVSRRSVEFVGKKLKISYPEACRINRIQYKIHGHTVKYLQSNNIDVSMQEFNDYVYGELDWDELGNYITANDVIRLIDLTNLNNFQNQKSILFTNAPEVWVENTLNLMGGDTSMFFDEVYCAESIFELKPNLCLYDSIEKKHPNDKLLFIDDGLLNVSNLGNRWATRHFTDSDTVYEAGIQLIQSGANCYL